MDLEKLKYPRGRFSYPETSSIDDRSIWIHSIETLPSKISEVTNGFSETQWNTPYRPEGWTVKQLVHHIADSHMNSFVRFKLGLTEDNPTIKPYRQDAWVRMQDVEQLPAKISLNILENLHMRFTLVLKNMTEEDFARTIYHPEMEKSLSLAAMLALYGWHSEHHLAHITNLIERENW